MWGPVRLNVMVTDLFARAGALRPAYDAVDWSATSFGPVVEWTPALRSAVDMLLGTRFPVTLMWGDDYALLYNEAYVEMIDGKHPGALGAPAREVFPEAWDIIGPMLDSVTETGVATWVEDAYVPLLRSGYLEECYFTFSYSPVRSPGGPVEGVIDIASETTAQVLAQRRLALLTRLGNALADVDDLARLRDTALDLLVMADLPTVELWLPGAGEPRPDLPALDPAKPLVISDEGGHAWLPLPTSHRDLDGAVLEVTLNPQRDIDDAYRSLLLLVAASLARAADRVVTTTAERSFSAALQVSLLSEPVRTPELDVAVRYLPAVEVAQIGGDWYDSFRLPDGSLALVVGDVAGHDQDAAATMAQLRNLTRGVAHTVDGSPAAVLAGVDRAVRGLDVGAIATAVLVAVAADRRTACWSNAGHLPPVLLGADGAARLLETRPDLLLGLDPSLPRADHVVDLEPGSTLVLYTDGLVERRGVPLQESLDDLADAVAGCQDLTADELCTRLLEHAGDTGDDDVALLVLRRRE
jgi:hypothetical protein